MNLYQIDVKTFEIFLLVFVRVLVILIFFPLFNSIYIPAIAKIGLSFILAMLIFPFAKLNNFYSVNSLMFFKLILTQIFIASILSIVVILFFAVFQVAGHFLDIQIGFAFSNMVDPISNVSTTVIERYYSLFIMLIFLLINGHYYFIYAIIESFNILPLDTLNFNPIIVKNISLLFVFLLKYAVKLVLPIIASLYITDIIFGFLAKLSPQTNIIFVAFPLKILLGLFLLLLSLKIFSVVLPSYFLKMYKQMIFVLRRLS